MLAVEEQRWQALAGNIMRHARLFAVHTIDSLTTRSKFIKIKFHQPTTIKVELQVVIEFEPNLLNI